MLDTLEQSELEAASQALRLLNEGDAAGATVLLYNEFQNNRAAVELCRVANLITPCGMIEQAKVALAAFVNHQTIAEYCLHPPADMDISRRAVLLPHGHQA